MTCAMKKLNAPQNLTVLAYDSIKAYILREELDENVRLTEDLLSGQLGISKSPVREALNSLHTEGLIRIEARRGAYLRRFSVKEVKDLYELREAIEVYAVGVAKLSPRLIADLKSSIQRTKKFLKANDRIRLRIFVEKCKFPLVRVQTVVALDEAVALIRIGDVGVDLSSVARSTAIS